MQNLSDPERYFNFAPLLLFRKYTNYILGWKVNLADNHVAMAPYGGPVGKEEHITLMVTSGGIAC